MTIRGASLWPILAAALALVPLSKVVSQEQDPVKARLRQADRAVSARDFQKAVTAYQSALDELKEAPGRSSERDVIRLRLARAQRSAGDLEAALNSLGVLRRSCEDPGLRAEAFTESVETAKEKKDRPALEKALADMSSQPEPLAGLAALEKGRILYQDSSFSEALAIFQELAASDRPCAPEAAVYRIRCLRALKKNEDLDAACREALGADKPASPALLQAAGSHLAELIFEKSKDGRAAVREALLISARAASAGPPSRDDAAEDYVRALLVEARCYLALASTAEAPAAKETYGERAAGLYREVASSYRGTRGTEEAEAALKASEGHKPKSESEKPKKSHRSAPENRR